MSFRHSPHSVQSIASDAVSLSPPPRTAFISITTINRNSLGAINAVDYMPWAGDMRGVRVTNNVINARSSMIKIGIAVGVLIWSNANAVTNSTKGRNHGAVFEGNTLTSSNPDGSIGIGYFGYAMYVFCFLSLGSDQGLIYWERSQSGLGKRQLDCSHQLYLAR